MSVSTSGVRFISALLMLGLLMGGVSTRSVSAEELVTCEEGEVFSEELESCVTEDTSSEGEGEFCSIVSDPLTKEAGEPSVIVSTLSEFWTAVISEAFWIWGEDPVATPETTTVETFTRTFTLSGIPLDAELHIAADDGYRATLNGSVIGEADGLDSVNFTLEGQDTFSIDTSLFAEGENTLVVEATNIAWGAGGENPGGILFRLELNGASCSEDGGGDTEDRGTIIIEKELEGGDENAFFTFSIAPEEGEESLLVVETGGRFGSNEIDLEKGWYTISELTPEGWTLGSVVCNDEDSIEFAKISEEEPSLTESVYLDEEEEITCVFVNVKNQSEGDDEENDGGTNKSKKRSTSGGQVLGASTECSPLLTTYLGRSYANPVEEVTKLQNFLNETEGAGIPVTGLFDSETEQAVRVFQAKYWEDVLKPWFAFPQFGVLDSDDATGIVYKTTKWKVNELFCPGSEALPTLP